MAVDKELLKGTIPFMVLHLIEQKDLYGYQIIRELSELSSEVFIFKEGTLYPILHSLEKEGCILSYWQESMIGRKRKYYKITDVGRKQHVDNLIQWNLFKSAVETVLTREVSQNDD